MWKLNNKYLLYWKIYVVGSVMKLIEKCDYCEIEYLLVKSEWNYIELKKYS